MTGRIFASHAAPITGEDECVAWYFHTCESVCAFITTPQFSCLLSSPLPFMVSYCYQVAASDRSVEKLLTISHGSKENAKKEDTRAVWFILAKA